MHSVLYYYVSFFAGAAAVLLLVLPAISPAPQRHQLTVEDVRYIEEIANGTAATLVAGASYDLHTRDGTRVYSFHTVDVYTLPVGDRRIDLDRIVRYALARAEEMTGIPNWHFQTRVLDQKRLDENLLLKVGVYGVMYEENTNATRFIA